MKSLRRYYPLNAFLFLLNLALALVNAWLYLHSHRLVSLVAMFVGFFGVGIVICGTIYLERTQRQINAMLAGVKTYG